MTQTAVPTRPESKRRTSAAGVRYPVLDVMRFIAAIGIIWVHLTIGLPLTNRADWTFAGRWAVPFFTASSVYLALASLARRPVTFPRYALSRLRRLGYPFIAWSAIYLLLKRDTDVLSRPIRLIVEGGDYHLWFLPFLWLASMLTFAVHRLMMPMTEPRRRMAWAGCAVAAIALAFLPRYGIVGSFDWPFHLWCDALPSVFVGAALFAGTRPAGRDGPKSTEFVNGGLIAIALLAVSGLLATTQFQTLLFTLAGACLLSVCLRVRGNYGFLAATFGRLAFGVYLVHVLFVGVWRSFALRHNLDQSAVAALLALPVIVLLATAAAAVLSSSRLTRWLVN